MMRFFKERLLVILTLSALSNGQAFTPIGPSEGNPALAWQTAALGYNLPGDIGGPVRLTEAYRWNIPNVYYAMDESFLRYFGNRGEQEIDKAFAILNALPSASSMSESLREYPQTGMLRENYQAAALGLLDVKSSALEMLVEELGLADPIRWTWALRAREEETIGTITVTNYTVVQFNYDPVTRAPSRYVNGNLLGYQVLEPLAPGDYADAVETGLDPVYPNDFVPVASKMSFVGDYWRGLTRDDVGGLRFLLQPNNMVTESIPPGSLLAVTNPVSQLLTNLDLQTFIGQTSMTTNDTAAVLAQYPDLDITGSNQVLLAVQQTNVLFYFSNAPMVHPLLSAQVVSTNQTTNIVSYWNYTYSNVVTNEETGSFHIVPTTLLGYAVVTNLLTNLVAVTNLSSESHGWFVDTNSPVPLSTSNLAQFSEIALTNSPAALQAIYPDLVITASYYVLTIKAFTNYFLTFTNPPFAPVGTVIPVFNEVVTNVVATNFYHTYGNIVTNTQYPWSPVTVERMEVYPSPFAPSGSGFMTTNYVNHTYYSNFINGSFYIVPTNLVGYQLISTLLTNDLTLTNIIQPAFLGTNALGTNNVGTNVVSTNLSLMFTNVALLTHGTNYTFSVFPVQRLWTTTNAAGSNIYSTTNPIVVRYFTNVAQSVRPIEFQALTNINLRFGVDKITFKNVTENFDSLIGQFFTPITNTYVDLIRTNRVNVSQVVRRILGAPDILFVSEDLGLLDNLVPAQIRRTDTANWVNNDLINGQGNSAGPGVITPPIQISFTDQLPFYLNINPFFINDTRQVAGGFVWGTFDSSTNVPVVYPDLLSIQELERRVLGNP